MRGLTFREAHGGVSHGRECASGSHRKMSIFTVVHFRRRDFLFPTVSGIFFERSPKKQYAPRFACSHETSALASVPDNL